uniref:RNA-directed DNA polymerase, eukaryota, reverse transcriptase zinc-binding domain protein n=1 Tax=Tanacetum cinerariifolium TaxID=118510 RepID=A0A699HC75_TANCI|nr:RNA-directed DNA polymerase, eukaryota, reverse transcriptase zinc-binding domain protein [Tanacetum cinerariifolium]
MGDFNEARFASERYGTIFHASHTDIFNSFIIDSHLIDVPLGGYSFTRSNKHASKMGKLYRFLISEGLFELFLNLSGSILHRHLSDHKLIFLRETYMDYSPTPFRLFHSWFLENDFVSVVEDSWNNVVVHDLNAMVFLKNKLKILKHKLKACSCQKRSNREFDRKELHDKLIDIDSCLNKGEGLHDDVYNRADVFHKIGEIDLKNSTDMAKKSKIKWAIEGDENSKFFHGIVNKNVDNKLLKEFWWMCKAKNEQALMFKVDFQKAFDSVRWDYLDDILDKVPDGVLNKLEGLCNSFFLGADIGIWIDAIKAIHGSNGALNQPLPNRLGCSVWNMVQKAIGNLKSKNVDLMEFCKKAFSFRRRPRGGIEECQWIEFSQLLSSMVLSSSSDRYSWSLNEDGVSSVKSAREVIDNHVLANSTSTTR